MFDEIEVVSIKEGGYYSSGTVHGSTVDVTMRRDDEFASCEGILIWEAADNEELDEMFEMWKQFAEAGEEGYKYWTE